jgi:hypothetical protein
VKPGSVRWISLPFPPSFLSRGLTISALTVAGRANTTEGGCPTQGLGPRGRNKQGWFPSKFVGDRLQILIETNPAYFDHAAQDTALGSPPSLFTAAFNVTAIDASGAAFQINTHTHTQSEEDVPVIWNKGTAMSAQPPGSGITAPMSSPSFMAVPTPLCVWHTPFGKPVEPEVYMIMASSSGPTLLFGAFLPLWLARTASHEAAPGASPRTQMV